MKNRNLVPLKTILLALTGVCWLSGCSRRTEGGGGPSDLSSNITLTAVQQQRIHVQPVQSSTFQRTVETTGTVGFDNDQATTVLAPISGPVTQILFSLGDPVKAGDPLAKVDSPDFAAAVSAYRKAVATAENARRIADLDEQLFKDDTIARRDVEQAQTDAINAEADRDAALQQLHSLGVENQTIEDIRLNRSTTYQRGMIRAPISGTLVEKLITPGQLLQAGTTPCFTVADLSQVWVMANIFESDIASIAVGDPAEIYTGASQQSLPGTVDNISAILDPGTRAIGVRVAAKNPDGVLKKQMYVRVLIRSRKETSGLLVPVSAVLRDDENLPFVYLAQSDGSFARRRVTLGDHTGDQFEITSGLKAGEPVVVEGGLFMQFLQSQ